MQFLAANAEAAGRFNHKGDTSKIVQKAILAIDGMEVRSSHGQRPYSRCFLALSVSTPQAAGMHASIGSLNADGTASALGVGSTGFLRFSRCTTAGTPGNVMEDAWTNEPISSLLAAPTTPWTLQNTASVCDTFFH